MLGDQQYGIDSEAIAPERECPSHGATDCKSVRFRESPAQFALGKLVHVQRNNLESALRSLPIERVGLKYAADDRIGVRVATILRDDRGDALDALTRTRFGSEDGVQEGNN